VFLI
jgi:hypothetical protein